MHFPLSTILTKTLLNINFVTLVMLKIYVITFIVGSPKRQLSYLLAGATVFVGFGGRKP